MGYVEIIAYCSEKTDDAHRSSGDMEIPIVSLASAGWDIRSFSYSELRAACVGLSLTMLFRGMNAVIAPDHVVLWDTIGQRLLDIPSLYFSEVIDRPFPLEEAPFRKLFVTTIKTCTREWGLVQGDPLSKWRWFQKPVGDSAAFGVNPAEYLVYPLLEGVLKRRLSSHISRAGLVTSPFSVDGRAYGQGSRCSRVDHMLSLLLQQESSSNLATDLGQILNHIALLYPNSKPEAVIAREWRNPAMHGESALPTAYGILLNFVLLVAMADVRSELIRDIGE